MKPRDPHNTRAALRAAGPMRDRRAPRGGDKAAERAEIEEGRRELGELHPDDADLLDHLDEGDDE